MMVTASPIGAYSSMLCKEFISLMMPVGVITPGAQTVGLASNVPFCKNRSSNSRQFEVECVHVFSRFPEGKDVRVQAIKSGSVGSDRSEKVSFTFAAMAT
ncbi:MULTISPECIES: hypothetical protein [unclassified Bradyrhizobium]|uniref:hypothetical protein n=1 Tax=unclassified Bradyrhizobium TaxID=2631580 RepID=UPI002916008A|nr:MULTISPECIES: hypothetical protein [unclassified Bradyrhizobium]